MALVSQWVLDGTLLKLIEAVQEEAKIRQKIALEILGSGRFVAQPDGYHLWLPRPDGISGQQTSAAAAFAGLPVVPASVFTPQPTGIEQSLRVSLGGMRTRERLASDLGRLDSILARSDRGQELL